jgi:hypothetical protein
MGQIASGRGNYRSTSGNQTKRSEDQTTGEKMIWIMEFDQFRCQPKRNHQEEQESGQAKKEASKGRINHEKDED